MFIADDQAMVREGFTYLLDAQPGLSVVGTAGDGVAALARIAELSAQGARPDVVLMDIRMPKLDGLEATRRLLEPSKPDQATLPRVLVLTTFHLDKYVYQALRAGASGFILKDATATELVHAVRVVAAGESLLAPAVTRRLIADFVRADRSTPPVRPDT